MVIICKDFFNSIFLIARFFGAVLSNIILQVWTLFICQCCSYITIKKITLTHRVSRFLLHYQYLSNIKACCMLVVYVNLIILVQFLYLIFAGKYIIWNFLNKPVSQGNTKIGCLAKIIIKPWFNTNLNFTLFAQLPNYFHAPVFQHSRYWLT